MNDDMMSIDESTGDIRAADTTRTANPELFAETLGIACWLMTMSKHHKSLQMSDLESRVLPAILLKQFKVIKKDKMPIAFLSWAVVSDEVKSKFDECNEIPELTQWRAGQNLIVIDCISPFAPADKLTEHFLSKMSPSKEKKRVNKCH